MSVKVIKTKDRKPYRPLYHALVDKHFSAEFETDQQTFASWSASPFFFCNITLDDKGAVGTYAAFVLTNETMYKNILDGSLKEHQIKPIEPGEYGMPYLYWPSLIIENRTHAPYLIKSIFGEVAECVKKWELMVTHVYSIAFTKVSERLMRRYYFKNVGVYKHAGHDYPIMISKVSENPYLRAFIPQQ